MASIHESSESSEQEEQDYVYGVVPEEWCQVSKHGADRHPEKGEWLTFHKPHSHNQYQFVLYRVVEKANSTIKLLMNWQTRGSSSSRVTGKTELFDYRETDSLKLTPRVGWFPITEEMAIKMKILHGF